MNNNIVTAVGLALIVSLTPLPSSAKGSGGKKPPAEDPAPSNPAPYVYITSPSGGNVFQVNTDIPFIGNSSGTLTWNSSVEGYIGTSNNFSAPLSILGAHRIRAEATNSDGVTGSTIRDIKVVDTKGYCLSKGLNQGDEWIEEVAVDGFSNLSGGFSSYSDYTTEVEPINLYRTGTSNVTLKRGIWLGIEAEYWRIWIDYNQNNQFEADEIAFQGYMPRYDYAPLSGQITVPANASTGSTRLRVSMKRNAYAESCETFQYGEVEDYTVNLQ